MAKKEQNWKERLGVVFSTDPDYEYKQQSGEETETPPPNQQMLRVMLDKKNRKGKAVTLIIGYEGATEDLEALGKWLKQQCGVGGSVKEGNILLQGDHRDRVVELLEKEGYGDVKRSGG